MITLYFAADHPTGAGHFPGNPIIPGALLLDRALHAIAQATGKNTDSYDIKSAKFLHPVRPGQSVSIAWEMQASGAIAFTGTIEPDTRVLSGSVALC